MQRLSEGELYRPRDSYRLSGMLDDLRSGIWGADLAGSGPIDLWRRNLQRAHVARLGALMVDPPVAPAAIPGAPAPVALAFTDIRPLARAQLVALRSSSRARLLRTTDPLTRAHLEDVGARITEILEPK